MLLIWVPMNALKRRLNRGWLFALLFSPVSSLIAQQANHTQEIHLIFYNTENFFDLRNDSLTQDDEFSHGAARGWNKVRFEKKRNDLARTILASCGYSPPAVVGLAEVENRYVLETLTGDGPLAGVNYRVIHKDSPDDRGIDLAVLYRSDLVRPFRYDCIPLRDSEGKIMSTREIVYAAFITTTGDTLHVVFNHWPSRYRGQAETEPERMTAALTLRQFLDGLLASSVPRYIVIMGDFNDQPGNRSLTEGLGARGAGTAGRPGEILNLSAGWKSGGTLKYRQSWQIFDQILISGYLLDQGPVQTKPEWAAIVSLPFLLEKDPAFKGTRPFRTYLGYRYHGGISDHLPVRLKILLRH